MAKFGNCMYMLYVRYPRTTQYTAMVTKVHLPSYSIATHKATQHPQYNPHITTQRITKT